MFQERLAFIYLVFSTRQSNWHWSHQHPLRFMDYVKKFETNFMKKKATIHGDLCINNVIMMSRLSSCNWMVAASKTNVEISL
jgi:hypothetical protein